ncbi:MAG: serine hydrolase [Clostridia bacterium]|nr:serine hydrolase [Clostridia bacterium]
MRYTNGAAALILSLILLFSCAFGPIYNSALAEEAYVTVKVGSKGDLVASIKAMLDGLGYDPGNGGDVYDAETKAAVKRFQTDSGLKSDGIAGPVTQKALNDAYSLMLLQGREVTAWAQNLLKSSGAVYGTVMVTKDGNPILTWSLGGVDKDTCFRIASVTKWVTAIGLMTLYDAGKLDLDEDISMYLPFTVRNPAWPDTPITARMLLTHTSSLSPEATDYKVNWKRIGVKGYDPIFMEEVQPGTRYTYADFDGALYGALIEAISGESVQRYLDRTVFQPLGITAAYTPSLLPKGTKTQSLLSPKGQTQISVQRDIDRGYHNTADPEGNLGYTVGRLYINASSLTVLAEMMLSGGALGTVRILKESTVALMEADQASLAASPYGLSSIRLNAYPRGTWFGHQGRYSGLTSNVYYQRETGMTAVLILDGYDYTLVDNIVQPADTLLNATEQIEAMRP